MSVRWPAAAVGTTPSDRTTSAGQVLVLFAIGIFVVLGAVGLGLDGSRTFEERRAAQTAVDHAATAAAFASCTGSNVATSQAAGQTAAMRNGFDNGAASITVAVDPVVGQTDTFKATISSTIPGTFARVLGINDFTVSVEATAGGVDCGAGGGGLGPIFAGGEICGDGSSLRNIEISGNDHIVTGTTHTNGNYHNGGSASVFQYKLPPYDPTPPANPPSVTYAGTFSGGSNTYTGAAQDTNTVQAWPAGYGPLDQTTAMWNLYKNSPDRRNTGSNTQSTININTNGIYYTEANGTTVDVKINSASVTSFTVVSTRSPIKFGDGYPNNRVFTAWPAPAGAPENIIVASGFTHSQNCDQFSIEKSGNGGTWNGIWWGPKAMVRWSGNEGTLNGAVISHAFQMNGNEHILNGDPSPFQSDPSVLILK